jgi:hypothetical protein
MRSPLRLCHEYDDFTMAGRPLLGKAVFVAHYGRQK